ncbi:MAG: hypothetical protein QNJ41_07950 [Xenococcaceae cyanobacterium MO_188.B32]|nr:hypothetical protein [Xenococcaceae cyanobacterium MO_188.B32]
MNSWQKFLEICSRGAKRYQNLFLPEHRVDVKDYDSTAIQAGEAYCRIWLVEMRLAKDVDWFKHRYPVVHAATRFNYGGQTVTIPYLAGPSYLQDLGVTNLDRVIQYNYSLTPLFPFNQGSIELYAGLFSMAASDPIGKFITTMERFSDLLPVPELSTVVNLADPVYRGIEDLLDIGDRRLELGYHQTFSGAGGRGGNTLRAGYFAAILAEENQLDREALCVIDDSLYLGKLGMSKISRQNCQPLKGYSYMLFRLEKRKAQDWESLTRIKELVYQAQDAASEGKYEVVKHTLIPAIRTAIYRSADVAKADRRPMILKIEESLREFGLQAAKVPARSLYAIMQRPLPKVDEETEKELTTLERLFNQ